MLGRRRVFAVEPLGRDGAGKDLACSCVVPGVTSTYRRIPDAAHGCPSDTRKEEVELRNLRRQVPLLKLASRDSGVEMVVGDSPLATLSELSQDSLNLEPMGSPEHLPPAQLGRLLANHKLEQVLERSRQLPSVSGDHGSLSKPKCGVSLFGAGEQETTEAETKLEAGLEAEVVNPGSWACLPGQGLRYLEHLCLVLEQMARLQQLYLQLQTQRPLGVKEESALVPLPSPSPTPVNGVQGTGELLSRTKETGADAALSQKVGVLSINPPRLTEAPVEPTHSFLLSQEHKQDLSHWDKVKVLLNRIRWRSSQHPEPPAPPNGSDPRIETRDLSERPQYHPHRKTFMPSLMVKKRRGKNLSV
uniref:Chromosome 8 open reading frame 58 n=1 Tax=Ictidomys tridecemlineatus TaxID=43179 RepID=I3N850_ICTTR